MRQAAANIAFQRTRRRSPGEVWRGKRGPCGLAAEAASFGVPGLVGGRGRME